jgi:hypothetical protein
MLNYTNDTQAVFETFLDDIQDTSKPFLMHYFEALNEVGTIDFAELVQSRFPEYFKRFQDDASLLMAA